MQRYVKINNEWQLEETAPDLSSYAKTANLATVATTGNYNDLTNKPTNTSSGWTKILDTTLSVTKSSGTLTISLPTVMSTSKCYDICITGSMGCFLHATMFNAGEWKLYGTASADSMYDSAIVSARFYNATSSIGSLFVNYSNSGALFGINSGRTSYCYTSTTKTGGSAQLNTGADSISIGSFNGAGTIRVIVCEI